MPANSLSLSYLVDEAQCQVTLDCQVNVMRRYAHLRFGSTVRNDAVPIAFLKIPSISADLNLVLNSQVQESLIVNQADTTTETRQASPTFMVPGEDFLLTDVMVLDKLGNLQALYYLHSLPLTAQSGSSVQVLDQKLNPVDPSLWLYWHTEHENSIYSNLNSTYDPKTGTFQAYFASYLDANGVQQITLLSNQPAFSLAQVEDYANFAPWRRLYTLDIKKTYFQIESLFNPQHSPTRIPGAINTLSYRLNNNLQGLLMAPSLVGPNDPWFPRLGAERFYLTGLDGRSHCYQVPEYNNQIFLPYEPYKQNANSPGVILGNNLVKAAHRDIHIDPTNGFHLSISVYQYDGQVRYAFTTDPNLFLHLGLDGQASGAHYRTNGIASIDQQGGFIQLTQAINPDDQVYLTYHFNEKAYEYLDLNLNPLFNTAAAAGQHYLYLMPDRLILEKIGLGCDGNDIGILAPACAGLLPNQKLTSAAHSLTDDYFYKSEVLILDAYGVPFNRYQDQVLEAVHGGQIVLVNHSLYNHIGPANTGEVTSQGFTFPFANLGAGFLIDINAAGIDGIANSLRSLNPTQVAQFTEAISLAINTVGNNLALFDDPNRRLYHLSIDAAGVVIASNHPYLTVLGQTLTHFENWYSTATTNCYQFQILGSFNLTPNSGVAQILDLDARRRGGGINPDLSGSLSSTYPEIRWCFDEGRLDGHPYPAAVAQLIEVPWTMLKDYGGQLTPAEILARVDKHMALGTYPVIRYYGHLDPRNIQALVTSTTAQITWDDLGGPYTVYWDTLPQSLRHSRICTTASLELTGLTPLTTYYYLVTNIRDNSRVLEPVIRSFTTTS